MSDTGRETRSLGQGVYYARADYVGLAARFAIILVDLAALSAVFLSAAALSHAVWPDLDRRAIFFNGRIPAAVSIFAYLVLLKRTTCRTIGYRLLGARVVNLICCSARSGGHRRKAASAEL